MEPISDHALPPDTSLDRATGCIIGAFCGDAIGTPVEFTNKEIGEAMLKKVMDMEIPGVFGTVPGQITDDSELALSLLNGLNACPPGVFDLGKIANAYGEWINSSPFDVGNTIGNALCEEYKKDKHDPKAICARAKNFDSQSNGSLMRITPLAVYVSNIKDNKKLAEIVKAEVSLTHSNAIIQDAGVAYCIAIRELINGKSPKEAYEATKKWAVENGTTGFKEWFNVIEKREQMKTVVKMGWAKIPFTYGFIYLLDGKDYETAVRSIVAKGGDTDTTGAIVGGLIGAAEGFNKIPKRIRDKMLKSDPNEGKVPRPNSLCPSKCDLLRLIKDLFEKRPDDSVKII